MSSPPQIPSSSSQFGSILESALSEYKKQTGKDLLDNWLTKELQDCDSVDAVLDIIQHQAEALDKFGDGDKKLMKWIGSSVQILYVISATLGEGVGVSLSPAKAVFAGIAVLLAATKDSRASHDVLVHLFQHIEFFLKRLGVETLISPTKDMIEIYMKIVAEVLSILSTATKEMQQNRRHQISKLFSRDMFN
ncbi:hypothetical protein H4582DRAFT_2059367 [Lactarius indigo]|nr:hypothetical protein H4582DRAFT_2059367 [Lactarius indigo]